MKKKFKQAYKILIFLFGFASGLAFHDVVPLWLSIILVFGATVYIFYLTNNMDSWKITKE